MNRYVGTNQKMRRIKEEWWIK